MQALLKGEIVKLVQQLSEPGADRSLVGGKGAGLARMLAFGIPVPRAFAVTTAAYERFIQHNSLGETINDLLRPLDGKDATDVDRVTSGIQAEILAGEMPEDIVDELAKAYADFVGTVAVRSSGIAEDLEDASFAGLYESYLHVEGIDAVVEAVRGCWASSWTARVVTYRHRLGIDHASALVAVVVQRMVSADVAGVLFTGNPLNQRTDEIVINANYGLGESIASGLVTPDELILDSHTLALKRSVIGSKSLSCQRSSRGGIENVEVSEERRIVLSISTDQAQALALVARQVVELNEGMPQDIEWAIEGGEIFLLQCRDITGVDFQWDDDIESWHPARDSDETIWTHAWARSLWNGAITPLFYSVRARQMQNSDERIFRRYGFEDLIGVKRYKYYRGTVYLNADIERDYYTRALPPALRTYRTEYLPEEWHTEFIEAPTDWAFLSMHLRAFLTDKSAGFKRSIQAADDYAASHQDEVGAIAPAEVRLMSDAELRRTTTRILKIVEDTAVMVRPLFQVYYVQAFALFQEMLKRWYPGDRIEAMQQLISGLPETTLGGEEDQQVWALAAGLRDDPALLAVLNQDDGEAFFDALAASPAGEAWLDEYRAFIDRFGYRGHQDRDFWFDRRSEDPKIDIRNFRALVRADDATSPEAAEQRLIAQRLARTEDVVGAIRKQPLGAVKAEAFKVVLDYLHQFLVLRENERVFADQCTMAKKICFRELGLRLTERGLLATETDFYFLTEYELYDLAEGRLSARLARAKVRARRPAFERSLQHEEMPAPYLRGSEPLEDDSSPEAGDGLFIGAGLSRGTITGTARVIRQLDRLPALANGEILVCNSTDPGWSAAFRLAHGLVIESGGMLSHGACLSREHGLPAVNLPGAMRLVPDGATITVDGDKGTIQIKSDGGGE